MRTDQEIRDKIDELQSEADDLDSEFEEALEDEDIKEDSDKGEKLRFEFDQKKEALEDQIELLEWILGE